MQHGVLAIAVCGAMVMLLAAPATAVTGAKYPLKGKLITLHASAGVGCAGALVVDAAAVGYGQNSGKVFVLTGISGQTGDSRQIFCNVSSGGSVIGSSTPQGIGSFDLGSTGYVVNEGDNVSCNSGGCGTIDVTVTGVLVRKAP